MKYIIDLPENTRWIQCIMKNIKDGYFYIDSKQIEELTPYTEPEEYKSKKHGDCDRCAKDYGTLGCCSTVSNKWIYSCEQGMIDFARNEGYDDGLREAWRLFSDISNMSNEQKMIIFGYASFEHIVSHFDVKDVIKLIKIFQERETIATYQDFQAGDVIKSTDEDCADKAVVIKVFDDGIMFMFSSGNIGSCLVNPHKYWCKTGANVLENLNFSI